MWLVTAWGQVASYFAPMADLDRLDVQSLSDAPEPPGPDAERRQRFARLRVILGESPHDSTTDTPAP